MVHNLVRHTCDIAL